MLHRITKQNTEMLSLYDYLGRAAGKKLGEKVAAYAKLRKARYGTKEINHYGYQGEVMLYTKAFLDEYFKTERIFSREEDLTELNTQLTEDSYKISDESLIF